MYFFNGVNTTCVQCIIRCSFMQRKLLSDEERSAFILFIQRSESPNNSRKKGKNATPKWITSEGPI